MGVKFPQPAGRSGFHLAGLRGNMSSEQEVEMEVIGNRPATKEETVLKQKSAPRALDWFWCPWYAKVLWTLAAIYWVGLYAMMLVPAGLMSSFVSGAMILLAYLLNPISVIVILGRGFLKAKVACEDWTILPGMTPEHAERLRREREAAYLNPVDVRSGYLHQQYMDRSRRHPTGHGGL